MMLKKTQRRNEEGKRFLLSKNLRFTKNTCWNAAPSYSKVHIIPILDVP
jgi:hypothetical protein